MKNSQRAGLWLLVAALLAGTEFGYAQLRQVQLWPLQLIASSLWRVVEQQAATVSGNHLALGCLGLLLIGLLAEILSFWRRGGLGVSHPVTDAQAGARDVGR